MNKLQVTAEAKSVLKAHRKYGVTKFGGYSNAAWTKISAEVKRLIAAEKAAQKKHTKHTKACLSKGRGACTCKKGK